MLGSMHHSGCRSVYSLLTSRHFVNSRKVLQGKALLVREQGKGKRLNKSCSFRHGQKEQLWQSRQFGYHSPMSVTNTLWWLFTLHFGVRGRQEHHNLKIKDFSFVHLHNFCWYDHQNQEGWTSRKISTSNTTWQLYFYINDKLVIALWPRTIW